MFMIGKIFITNKKQRKRKFDESLFTEDSVSKIVPPPTKPIPEPEIDLKSKDYPVPKKA